MDLLLPFFSDAGLISINDYLFSLLDVNHPDGDDDGDLAVQDAVSVLRFFIRLIELGSGDALVTGAALGNLIKDNFPELHEFLTASDYKVDRPCSSRFNYRRFCGNFKQLMVSTLSLQETQSWFHSLELFLALVFRFIVFLDLIN